MTDCYKTPFPAAPLRDSSNVKDWLVALDKADMCFHFEDHPASIIWNDRVPTMTTEQVDRLNRRREEYLQMIGDSCCPFEYAHDVVGGGWKLPRRGNEEKGERAEHYIDALRELHEEPECDDSTTVTDFLADLMHLKGRRWLQDRMTMADGHFEAESEEA